MKNKDMEKAKIFGSSDTIVSAQDVQMDVVSRFDNEFVDPEEDFRVTFVQESRKRNRKAHFRLYYTREYYNSMNPDRKTKYDILSSQRHFEESEWHRSWEDKFKEYAEIEAYMKNTDTGRYKRADAYIPEILTCIEFQHSYIANDFEERNRFYDKLGVKTIWLYDLSESDVIEEDNECRILENNAKGFFRIAEDPDNLKNRIVLIQTKNGTIFRIDELKRKETEGELESTVRMFVPVAKYNEEEFITSVLNNEITLPEQKGLGDDFNYKYHSIYDLWNKQYYWIVVKDMKTGKYIIIFKDLFAKGEMRKDQYHKSVIQYQYVRWDYKERKYTILGDPNITYRLSSTDAKQERWVLIKSYTDAAYWTT